MATKKPAKKTVEEVTKAVKETAEKVANAVEEKAEDVVDIVEDKVADVVEEAKEVVKKAKKAATKKEVKTTLFVEYYGKQVEDKAIIASVKKAWTKSGHKVSDIKTMELYVKPEESAVYYVINKTDTGKVEF